MKEALVLIPVLLADLLVVIMSLLSNHESNSSAACAQAIRGRLADSSTYAQIAAEYKRGDETWSRDEMMHEVANEIDRITVTDANLLQSDDDGARQKLANDLKSGFAALLPAKGAHFGFAMSKIDFDSQDQPGVTVRRVAYCKFVVVDGADQREPFSVIIK